MKRQQKLSQGKPALELIEEAVHLLRLAPAGTLLRYYLGALPFVLALLYFWSDMSRSAFAEEHLAEAAAGLALLFGWMKLWQAAFAAQVRAQVAGRPAPRLTFGGALRILAAQTAVHATALFVLPVALVLAAPFGWAFAFCQNFTALGALEPDAPLREINRQAWRQCLLWQGQNHVVLSIFFLFGLFVFLNLGVGFATVPQLLKVLLGIESPFTLSATALFNTTFFAALIGLTYLCLDPILKTVYALRCFYGQSLQTGEDLRADLRGFQATAKLAVLFLTACLLLNGAVTTRAAGAESPAPPPAPATGAASPGELSRSIDVVISQREYAWRLPREKTAKEKTPKDEKETKWRERLEKWLKEKTQGIRDFFRKLFQFKPGTRKGGTFLDWTLFSPLGLTLIFVALVLGTVIFLLVRLWQRRRNEKVIEAETAVIAAVPDLANENIAADQLPEDGWLRLARELLERGELRLALRAFYLASLAHLAEKNLVTLARFKSNHDYERELRRRSHALPELHGMFAENVNVFDRVGYGLHEVNAELLQHFAHNVERIKSC